jgi:hypothetical protein
MNGGENLGQQNNCSFYIIVPWEFGCFAKEVGCELRKFYIILLGGGLLKPTENLM